MRRHQGAKVKHFDFSDVIYHKFSHGAVFYTLNGKNVNVMLEFVIVSCYFNLSSRKFMMLLCKFILQSRKNVNIFIYLILLRFHRRDIKIILILKKVIFYLFRIYIKFKIFMSAAKKAGY